MRKWRATLLRYASTQGVVQLLQFAAGLIIVRSLPKLDYAWYAIVVSVIAAMTVLAESGMTSALTSRGAGYLNDRARLSGLFATALRFRLRFGAVVVLCGDVVLVILLSVNDAPPLMIVLAVALTSLTLIPTFNKGISQVHARLRRNYRLLQSTSLISAAARVALIAVAGFFGFANMLALLTVGLATTAFEAWRLRSHAAREIDFHSMSQESDQRLLRSNLKQMLPMNLLLVLQGQLIYFLLGVLGTPQIVAEVSALSRFSLVFSVLLMVVTDVGSGVIASAPSARRTLARLFSKVLGLYGASLLVIVAVCIPLSPVLVMLLGSQYAGLETPLVIIIIGTAAVSGSDAFRTLNQARGWLHWSWLYLPLTVVWAVTGLFFLDITTITGAALFMATQAIPSLLTQTCCFIAGVIRKSNALPAEG